MTYAKLENGILHLAPARLTINGRVHYHPSAVLYLSQGYKPVQYTDKPEQSLEGSKYYASEWSENLIDGTIVQTWYETDPPVAHDPQPTIEDRVTKLESDVVETRDAMNLILSGETEEDVDEQRTEE